jgi:hypothetical protein
MIAWEYVEERVKHKASMACVFFGLCRDLAISGVSPPSHFDEERLELKGFFCRREVQFEEIDK